MAVFTLAGEKIGTQKSNWNRLLLLYKSHKFQNLYKENKYIKTIKYCSHFTLFPPPSSLGTTCLLVVTFSGKHL